MDSPERPPSMESCALAAYTRPRVPDAGYLLLPWSRPSLEMRFGVSNPPAVREPQ